jgi:hypothetical protein
MDWNIILACKIQEPFQTIGPRTLKNGDRLNLASPCAKRFFHSVNPIDQVRAAASIAFVRGKLVSGLMSPLVSH